MIFYFFGSNKEESWRAARAEFLRAREKLPEAPSFDLVGESLTLENLQEVVSARPLLGGGIIAFFSQLSDNPALVKFVSENLPSLIKSDNSFIFWESDEDLAQAVTAAGGEVKEFKTSESKTKPDQGSVNLFTVADALGNRDRKQLWLFYHDALRHGAPAEEIFWKFAWKVKTLLLVATATEGASLPLKPYPLAQAKRQLRNYNLAELTNLSSRLVKLYHDTRRGLTDFDLNLERLILEA